MCEIGQTLQPEPPNRNANETRTYLRVGEPAAVAPRERPEREARLLHHGRRHGRGAAEALWVLDWIVDGDIITGSKRGDVAFVIGAPTTHSRT